MSRPGLDLTLYLVTDAEVCGTRGVTETVRAAVAGGAYRGAAPGSSARRPVNSSTRRCGLRDILAGSGSALS